MRTLFKEQTVHIEKVFTPEADIILYDGNCEDFITQLPDKSIKLVITSPPYNVGKIYEQTIALEEYLQSLESVISGLVRVLADDGSICWQVGNYVDNGEVFPLDIYFYRIFKKFGLSLRNRIIWYFNHGLHASKRFSGRYETILWFTKTDNYTFNLDAVRVPSKYPGKRHFKGPKKGLPSCNPNGKNPSDIWEIISQDWKKLVWDIPNVKANHPEKTAHPCQFPIELVERCVLALTNENDRVFDPFLGSGSSVIAAIMHNRKALGCDKEPEYIKLTCDRIKSYRKGNLKIRPLGKPVYKPTGREKVSMIPEEWLKTKKEGLF
ncbi:MAG: site-specific DNA-methyltransferase [Phycisphaerae bacterium]|nr:site-specific DNA-methyltransferase [Phycisphaerae bacterium]